MANDEFRMTNDGLRRSSFVVRHSSFDKSRLVGSLCMPAKSPNGGRRHGVMLVMIAVCLPLCVLMAAFAVDVAWMQLVRTELRSATDAAARAGAKGLSLYQDRGAARETAKRAASRNQVAGDPMRLSNRDIEIGVSEQTDETSRFKFTSGGRFPNSVRVTGRRTSGSAAGAVSLLFSGVLGVREFEPVQVAISSLLDRDLCLVVDRSGSMMESATGPDEATKETDCFPPPADSRWVALAAAINGFLAELDNTLQEEHVAMVSYGSEFVRCKIYYPEVRVDSDLTTDYSTIRSAIDGIGNRPIQGHTHIGEGIDAGIGVLRGRKSRRFAVKTMILMTDGLQNGGTKAIDAARRARSREIVIHTITFGANAAQADMQQVAAATGGKHFHAPTPSDLERIFKEVALTLPVLTTE
jgi:hypothetical protein